MVISRSGSPGDRWIAGVRVFSGRPDPTWEPSATAVAALWTTWEELDPVPGPVPAGPPLGYGGCFLRRADGREWSAYEGVVTLRETGGSVSRRDPDRRFERLLLSSAPPGRLPAELGPSTSAST
jgi:hypothetical protein